MLGLLTNTLLDIGTGVAWWMTKTTINGISYGVSYTMGRYIWTETEDGCDLDKENDYILMSDFRHMLEEKNKTIDELQKQLEEKKNK